MEELLNDGDVIAITYDGVDNYFGIKINGGDEQHLFHCDGSQDYWFFFDLNENVETIYFIGGEKTTLKNGNQVALNILLRLFE